MTASIWRRAAGAGCIVWACTAAQAAPIPCEIVATAWGPRLTHCDLKLLSGGCFEGVIDRVPEPHRLPLPNLHVLDIDVPPNGTSADLYLTVRNSGIGAAGIFDMLLLASVHDPRNGGAAVPGYALTLMQTIGSLRGGASATRGMGTLGLPNRTLDWDVCVAAVVDARPAGSAAHGRVLESNENDNEGQHCCRIYGTSPDVGGMPACR